MGLLDFLLGNTSESKLKKLRPLLNKINALEPEISALTDKELRNKTQEFGTAKPWRNIRRHIGRGIRHSERPQSAQWACAHSMSAVGRHGASSGRIAEMRTGEGKTLVAVMPAYLNALTGKGVFIVTANDYLAKRDAQWMGKIYKFLGLTVGTIVADPLNANTIQARIQKQRHIIAMLYTPHTQR